ncbi:hypothetical protein [Streptomyces sp. NPDC005548]|uniref:hypothetical protein n=1 Tax=Streptomyces sp. NPDC005548 TaxID=3364724 RepID=UPI0036CE1858
MTTSAKKTPPRDGCEKSTCAPCGGTGEVARTVHVGRKRRPVGEQAGICLACFGTGEATD